jgi:unsaturated chondroitin disaccharide hydrolase
MECSVKIETQLVPADLSPAIKMLFNLAAEKTLRLGRRWQVAQGAPVVTAAGQYVGRNWTQWTQGFAYGNAILCYEMTGERELLTLGRDNIVHHMAEHLTHMGVHDHGFNNLSTYGNLRRLILEGGMDGDDWELRFYELALKTSGAIQAARWTSLPEGLGFIYSFNGSHSLFIDTVRTLRVCAVAHKLGHALLGEQEGRVNLLGRVLTHAKTSARFNIYYGEGRDIYDRPELSGRTAHEAIFNPVNGTFRCPSTQQGYTPFSTWTRGLAWAMLGFAEQLEFVKSLPASDFSSDELPSQSEAITMLERAAIATCDFYIHQGTASDGICYWDTGAPELHRLGDIRSRPADPYNQYEPVDASASAIAAQGLIRLGHALGAAGEGYFQAGIAVANTLLGQPYLSIDPAHDGILLHSIYHQPNGWDYIPAGSKTPYGESSMWGDYHMLELGLLIARLAENKYYTFF